MNTKVIIGIIFGIIAVVLGFWLMSEQGTGTAMSPEGESREQESTSVGQTFAQLMGMGQSLKCTYEYNDGTNVSSGTMYMTDEGERLRGEFSFTQSGAGPMQMNMVRVDGYNYMWGSAMPQGMKTKVTEENRAQLFDNSDANTAAINDTEYKCESWNVDASMFAVPTNVQFSDMSAMMDAMKGTMNDAMQAVPGARAEVGANGNLDVKAMQCAACDQAGSAREQCRQALGCK